MKRDLPIALNQQQQRQIKPQSIQFMLKKFVANDNVIINIQLNRTLKPLYANFIRKMQQKQFSRKFFSNTRDLKQFMYQLRIDNGMIEFKKNILSRLKLQKLSNNAYLKYKKTTYYQKNTSGLSLQIKQSKQKGQLTYLLGSSNLLTQAQDQINQSFFQILYCINNLMDIMQFVLIQQYINLKHRVTITPTMLIFILCNVKLKTKIQYKQVDIINPFSLWTNISQTKIQINDYNNRRSSENLMIQIQIDSIQKKTSIQNMNFNVEVGKQIKTQKYIQKLANMIRGINDRQVKSQTQINEFRSKYTKIIRQRYNKKFVTNQNQMQIQIYKYDMQQAQIFIKISQQMFTQFSKIWQETLLVQKQIPQYYFNFSKYISLQQSVMLMERVTYIKQNLIQKILLKADFYQKLPYSNIWKIKNIFKLYFEKKSHNMKQLNCISLQIALTRCFYYQKSIFETIKGKLDDIYNHQQDVNWINKIIQLKMQGEQTNQIKQNLSKIPQQVIKMIQQNQQFKKIGQLKVLIQQQLKKQRPDVKKFSQDILNQIKLLYNNGDAEKIKKLQDKLKQEIQVNNIYRKTVQSLNLQKQNLIKQNQVKIIQKNQESKKYSQLVNLQKSTLIKQNEMLKAQLGRKQLFYDDIVRKIMIFYFMSWKIQIKTVATTFQKLMNVGQNSPQVIKKMQQYLQNLYRNRYKKVNQIIKSWARNDQLVENYLRSILQQTFKILLYPQEAIVFNWSSYNTKRKYVTDGNEFYKKQIQSFYQNVV